MRHWQTTGRVLMAIVTGWAVGSTAARTDPDDVVDWQVAEWQRAKSGSVPDGLALRWRTEYHVIRDQQAVDAEGSLLALTDAARHDPSLLDRRLPEPIIKEFTVRMRGKTSWRYTEDAVQGHAPVAYIDRVRTPTHAWKMTPSWLVKLPIDRAVAGHPIDSVLGEGLQEIAFMRYAAAAMGRIRTMELDRPITNGAAWSYTARDTIDGSVFACRGTWHAAAERGLTTEITATDGPILGARWELDGWALVPESEFWYATEVSRYDPDGRLRQRSTMIEATTERPDVFDAMVAAPDFGAHDEMRGALALRSISDHSVEPALERVMTDSGVAEFPLDEPQQAIDAGEADYRRLGFTSAGLIITALVWLRIRRSSRSSRLVKAAT